MSSSSSPSSSSSSSPSPSPGSRDSRDSRDLPIEMLLPVMDGSMRLAAQLWLPKGVENAHQCSERKRVIAYPGWLDNAGSFKALAQCLSSDKYGFAMLCVDPPGCGLSDHRDGGSAYNDFDEAPLIPMLADSLGWEKFSIVSHSRGGGVGSLATGAFPERVLSFVMIENTFGVNGLWQRVMESGKPTPPDRMLRAYHQVMRNAERKVKGPRVFKSLKEAIDASEYSEDFPKSRETATNIVARHVRECKDGFTFMHDVRTYGDSGFVVMEESTMLQFLKNIDCHVLRIIRPEQVDRYENSKNPTVKQRVLKRFEAVKHLEHHQIEGGHHLHSDLAPQVAALVGPWIDNAVAKFLAVQENHSASQSSSQAYSKL